MLPNMTRLAILMAAATLSLPSAAQAWGKTGHRVGGAIAQTYLSSSAKSAMTGILGFEGPAESSTWPDFMRSSSDAFWQGDSRTWHYVTVPKGETYEDGSVPESGDAITALSAFRETLRNPAATQDEKERALRFAIHIIGDLHQPLHAGNGTDRGGNDFKITWFGESTNLHSVWDTKLVDYQQLSYSEYADWLGRQITPELAAKWNTADPVVWVSESTELRDRIYPAEGADLRWQYNFEHKGDLDLRLSQSGVRLAAWLNETFAAE